jgi:putative methyltransferase (TIGR04325 family)
MGLPIFLEKYESYDSALESRRNFSGEPYESLRWLDRQKSFLVEASNGRASRPSSLPEYLLNRKFRSVVDFGGGSGWLFEFIRTKIEMSAYTVIELPTTCEAFAPEHIERVNFLYLESSQSGISNLKKSDIFYSNSTLQYIQLYSVFLDSIRMCQPEMIILDDLTCSDDKTFYSLQRYYDSALIYCFHSKLEILRLFADLGYELKSETNYPVIKDPKMDWALVQGENLYTELPTPKTYVFEKS